MTLTRTALMLLLAALVPAFFAISATPTQAQADGESADDAEAVELRWQWNEGDIRYMVERNSLVQSINGGPQQTPNDTTTYSRYEVTSVDDDGTATVTVTFDEVVLVFVDPMTGQTDTFDSRTDNSADYTSPVVTIVSQLLDASIEFDVTATGRISEVRGYAELFEEFLESQPAEQREMLGATLRNETMQQQLETMMSMLPQEAVAAGASWERTSETEAPLGTITQNLTYTLDGVHDTDGGALASISVAGDVDMKFRADNPMLPAGSEMSLESSDVSGTIVFNNTTGAIEQMSQAIEMSLVLSMGGQEFTVDQTNTVEGKSLSEASYNDAIGAEDEEDGE